MGFRMIITGRFPRLDSLVSFQTYTATQGAMVGNGTATWVRRPFEDDDDLQPPEGKIYLSDFQVEKFTYYFTDVFDHNKDRVITIEDIHALNEVFRNQ
ncbi:hypothetical protein E2C01_039215 [Portunus trituberculatus]|uniref:EF-hand domain-containing protein n=1 Tax=Portunus trituberculatus TaxID=210409 RepID=A0A5B7FJ30_PORTR|nr:hypothetical protein [Portunus trituberculatus]